jgi:hypothetical protein
MAGFLSRFFYLIPLVFLIAACSGGGGSAGSSGNDTANPSSAARSSLLPANDADCPAGGVLVESGIDDNGDVSGSAYVFQ